MEAPKGITVNSIYEPDMKKMVKALRIILESTELSKSRVRKDMKESNLHGTNQNHKDDGLIN